MEAVVRTVPEVEDRSQTALGQCVTALEAARRVLVCMHEFPDGDALGSALSLALALTERGKQVVVYSPQGAPCTPITGPTPLPAPMQKCSFAWRS